jgi:Xaa-Pro aminopeptidase
MSTKFKERIDNLKDKIKLLNAQGLLITNLVNIRYLTGFSGSAAEILITLNKDYFFTDGRYIEYAKNNIKYFKLIETKEFLKTLFFILKKERIKKLLLEADDLTVEKKELLKDALTSEKIKLINTTSLVMSLRLHKQQEELQKIKQAISASITVFKEILDLIKVNTISEYDLALELEYKIKKKGLDVAFPPIVASGYNSCLPHAKPTQKKLCLNECLIIDFGIAVDGYNSDITRTLLIAPDKEKLRFFKALASTHQDILGYLKPGISVKSLYKFAQKRLLDYSYIKKAYIKHNLGHGIGLQVHEEPALSGKNNTKLNQGMVITIEPGIYIPNIGGFRIEDMVYIKEDKAEILTKDLPIIIDVTR